MNRDAAVTSVDGRSIRLTADVSHQNIQFCSIDPIGLNIKSRDNQSSTNYRFGFVSHSLLGDALHGTLGGGAFTVLENEQPYEQEEDNADTNAQ